LFTDVSGQRIGLIFKGQEVQEEKEAGKTLRSLYREGVVGDLNIVSYADNLRESLQLHARVRNGHRSASISYLCNEPECSVT
jgi:hypothetical protein